MKRIKHLLLLVLAVAMTFVLALGFAACGEEETPVTYSVTVSCDDATVLSAVKVRLDKEGKQSEEKALTDGKATFELEAGAYTVVLTGVPENYTYETKTVTESAPDATVTLTKKNDPPADGLVSYTVTVTCEDETVLSGVKVKLMLGSDPVEEKELTDGKASFKLQPGDYTVTLTGVPADYTYETKKLTEPNSAVTIALTKVSTSADVTVKVAAGKDVFGADRPETLLQNASVEFYLSDKDLKPYAFAFTNENGVAHFETLAAGTYFVNVNGKEFRNVSVSGNAATVTLNEKLGSEAAPLVWKVGENDVPLTEDILNALNDASVYYTLVVEEDGLYSFDADNYNANVTGDLFEDGLVGMDTHVAVTLKAGTVYTFACSSTGALAESGEFGYKVTVTKGDTQEGGSDAPEVPWTGSGTQADPYVITSLKNSYRVQIKYENGAYVPVYFKYTETAAANYAIYSSDQNFYMTVGDNHYTGGGNASSEQSLFATAAGTDYVFILTPFDDEETSDMTVSFTIGDFTGYIPKWEGSGKFSTVTGVDDPFIVTTLVDSYEVHGADRVYFKYAATETKNYTVTLEGTDGFDFWLRNYNNGNPDSGAHYTLSASQKTATIALTQGTIYLFGVTGGSDGLDGNMAFAVKFTIAEVAGSETDPPENPGDGNSAENPDKIENIVGENTLGVSAAGIYYTFTVSQTGTYTFTAVTALCILDFENGGGKKLNNLQAAKAGTAKDYELTAGDVYLFRLTGFGENAGDTVTLKVELKAAAQEVTVPDEFNGTWKDVNGDYSLEIANGKLTLKKGDETVQTNLSEGSSSAMEGKTSYYVTFGGKTYTLQWNSVGEKALQLYLSEDDVIHFAPDPLPTFTFETAQQGEFAARNEEFPEHIVVSEDGIAWENHTILLLSDMSNAYDGYDKAFAAYVDGKPELLLFGNGAIYFQKASIYFDDVAASDIVTLPENYLGKWKSADGKVTLEVSANAVALKENGVAAEVSLKQEKVGSDTEYFLTWNEKDWQFLTLAEGVLTLQGEEYLHFAKDPLPTVDLTEFVGAYRCSLSVDYLVVEKNAIKWGDRTVILAAEPSATDYGTGYPFFADGKLYFFFIDMDGENLMLVNNDGGDDGELTRVGDTVPEADGSAEKPFVLKNFLGVQTFRSVPEAGVYYAFELPFEATLTVTASVKCNLEFGGRFWEVAGADDRSDFNLSAGVVILKLSGATEITLTIAMNYTVTVTSADKDVYGNTVNATAKAGVSVSLVKDGANVATAQTDDKGIATFSVTETGDYSVKIDNTEYSFTGTSCTAALLSDIVVGGSPEHPLTLKMGANEFPLTRAIMETYQGAYYAFTCTYSGKYVFTISEAYAMFLLSDEEDSIVSLGDSSLTQTVSLEKGKTYAAMVVSQGPTEFAFTLTIALDVGEIEGSGTRADPEVLKNFDSVARFVGTDADTSYYFRFLTDKSYSVVIKVSKNCRIGGALVGFSTQQLKADGTVTAELKKGVQTDFYVQALLNEGADIIELSFTATEVADAPWEGSGTSSDPYLLESLVGSYSVPVTYGKNVCFSFQATGGKTYRLTPEVQNDVSFILPSAQMPKVTKWTNSNSWTYVATAHQSDEFTINSAFKFVLKVTCNTSGESLEAKFKIEEVTA